MALQDPVAVYNAADNNEALFLRDLLEEAGIEAFAVEDLSMIGAMALGWIPELHKPQVWVDKHNVERAVPIIEKYENRSTNREPDDATDVFCYECGERVEPGAASCPACHAVLDWSDESREKGARLLLQPAERNAEDREAASGKPAVSLDTFRGFKKPLAWFYLSPFLVIGALLALTLLGALLGSLFR